MSEGLKTLKAGEYLFLQGESGHELYFLKSGVLEVILAPSNMEITPEAVTKHGQTIETFDQPGQLVGEISPILNCPRTASVRVAQDATLLAADMRPGAFESALRARPTLGIKIAEELARRVNKTNDRLKKQDMRLLRFLEELRVSLNSFQESGGTSCDTSTPELAGNLFIELANLSGTLSTLPADLPVSLALPYEQAGAFFSYFGGVSFQGGSGAQTQAASVADALAKVQGKKYPAGTNLCTSGEVANELFILLQGKLDVVVGRRTIQSVAGRGNMLGEMAFLLKTRRTASVIAVEPSMVLAVPFDKMEPLFARVPQLLVLMLKQLAGRLLQVDTLLQKSTWRTMFFSEVLPAFAQTLKASAEGLPASLPEGVRDAAHKSMALIEEAVNVMSKGGGADVAEAPFTLAEICSGEKLPPPAQVQDLQETPPGPDSPMEHVDFVLSLSDNRKIFGPPQTPRSRFAQYLNVDEQSLILGRIVGKIGQSGTYVEVSLSEDGTDETRKKLAEQISGAVGVPYFLFSKSPNRWLYRHEGSGGSAAVSAEAIPHAEQLLAPLAKAERASLPPLDRARTRRLHLEAMTSILESHWSAPGQFTELNPSETALIQFGATGETSTDRLKLDVPPGRTQVTVTDFAKRVVVQLAGGEMAVMGGVAAAKKLLPEKEKQIAELIENRKKAYADNQVPYEDAREGPLLQQIEKMTGLQRLKDKGAQTGEALRDFAAAEKDTEKLLDERNAFVTQKIKGDPGRKALSAIKAVEDQIRAALREKFDLVEAVQKPAAEADAQKEKDAPALLPINLLNGFRDLLTDFYARIRQAVQAESIDVTPLYSEGVRIYSGRDVGIALQKILEKDKSLPSGQDFPPILRLPGEGYSIYSPEWNVLIVPLFHATDPFQMMAHGVGELRWSRIPDSERKKYQKALKGGSSVKMDQLGIYFAREYRQLLDDKDVDEGSAKFIRDVMMAAPPPAAAPAPAAGTKSK